MKHHSDGSGFRTALFGLATAFVCLALSSCALWAKEPQTTLPAVTASVTAIPATATKALQPTPSPAPTATPTPEPTAEPTASVEEALDAYLAGMTLEEKLGQLVMFGVTGTTAPSSEFTRIIEDYHVGNFILYGANINREDGDGGFSDAARLISALQAASGGPIPCLVSIDVEGGTVFRFRWSPKTLSAQDLGLLPDTRTAYTQFLRIGQKLLETGISMNLAPVMDVAPSPMDTFLTTRIISADPSIAGGIGGAAVAGLRDAGCLSTLKHFPGHGGTNEDSHAVTPVVNKSEEDLRAYDLVPFRMGIDAGADTVLAAHILYPALDADDIASMSYPILTELLRGEMGFEGIIMSDDFRMGGLTARYTVEEAAVRFLQAGGDLILCGAVPDKQVRILNALAAAYSDGLLTEERIDESVRRILVKKMKSLDWSPMEHA